MFDTIPARQSLWNKLVSWLYEKSAIRVEIRENNRGLLNSLVASYCVSHIKDKFDRLEAQVSVNNFLQELYEIGTVDAVALLTCQEGSSGTTIMFEIFDPIIAGDESSTKTFEKVSQAKADLLGEQEVLDTTMAFVNTAGTSIPDLEPKARKRWKTDPTEHLLAFVVFKKQGQKEADQ